MESTPLGTTTVPSYNSMNMPNDFEEGDFTTQTFESKTNDVIEKTPTAEPSKPARPARHKERVSYSDYYQLASTSRKSDVHSNDAEKSTKKQTPKRAQEQTTNTRTNLELTPQPNSNSLQAQVLSIDADHSDRNSAANKSSIDAEALSATQSSRDRVMTSPLSSVPSDLDEAGLNLAIDVRTTTSGRGANANLSGSTSRENGSSTKKRAAANANGDDASEKKTKKNKRIKIRYADHSSV